MADLPEQVEIDEGLTVQLPPTLDGSPEGYRAIYQFLVGASNTKNRGSIRLGVSFDLFSWVCNHIITSILPLLWPLSPTCTLTTF